MRKRRQAFTLIELVMVLAVIGVLSALMVPSFAGNRAKAELREAAKQLWTTARFAQQHAVLRGVECRLVIIESPGEEGPGFRVEVATDDEDNAEGYATLRAGPIRSVTLPDGVFFDAVLIDGETRAASGDRVVRFMPSGAADAASIGVTDGQSTWTIAVYPHGGRCELFDRAIPNLPNQREDLDA